MISGKIALTDLPKVVIIGKEGLCTKEKNVVRDLWQQANSNFSDIAEIGMKLAGAVCDFTEPATGQNKLFFPVE